MVAYPSLAAAIFAAGWLSLVKAGYSGVLPSQLASFRPRSADRRVVELAIAVTIFGGFTPFVATWLIAVTGNKPVAELLHHVHRRAQHHRSRLCAAPPVSAVILSPQFQPSMPMPRSAM
jgi:hypothetical protein